MAQQQHGFLLGLAAEIHLQVVAEVGDAVELRAPAQRGEFFSGESTATVDRLLVVAGRFDLHQAANGVDDLIAMLLEVVKPSFGLWWADWETGTG